MPSAGGHLGIRQLAQQGKLCRRPRLALVVAGRDAKLLAAQLDGVQGSPQPVGEDGIRQGAQQLVLGGHPKFQFGHRPPSGQPEFQPMLADLIQGAAEAPCHFRILEPAQQLFLGAGPLFEEGTFAGGIDAAELVAVMHHAVEAALQAASHLGIGQDAEKLDFRRRPRLGFRPTTGDALVQAFVAHRLHLAVQLPGDFGVGERAQQPNFLRLPVPPRRTGLERGYLQCGSFIPDMEMSPVQPAGQLVVVAGAKQFNFVVGPRAGSDMWLAAPLLKPDRRDGRGITWRPDCRWGFSFLNVSIHNHLPEGII